MNNKEILMRVSYYKIAQNVKANMLNRDEIQILLLYLMLTQAYMDIEKERVHLIKYIKRVNINKDILFLYVILSLDNVVTKCLDKEKLIKNILLAELNYIVDNNINHIETVESLQALLPEWKLKSLMVSYSDYCI